MPPHEGQPVLRSGATLESAGAAMILVHGRGAGADDILAIADEFARDDIAYLAPQAADYSWYPYSFLAPLEQNEPGLSSGLALLGSLYEECRTAGIDRSRTFLLGFSQGACLALEYTARNAAAVGAVFGLSGGLIGPPGTTFAYTGRLTGVHIYLGCSDRDPHIPLARVEESAAVFERMGASVKTDIFPNAPHAVFPEEIDQIIEILEQNLGPAR